MRQFIIKLNNWLVRNRRGRFRPGDILVLAPRCLQHRSCRQDVVGDPNNCLGCGKCDVADLLELSRRTGFGLSLVTGGGIALELVKKAEIKAIVAVACEKELVAGLLRKGRKPVLAIANRRPCGPCRDTRVDLGEVAAALLQLVKVSGF